MAIVCLLGTFIIMDGYHAIFNTTFEKLKKTKIVWFRSIADTLFIMFFWFITWWIWFNLTYCIHDYML